jgi:O-antigen/teichoic acid export membrane protein
MLSHTGTIIVLSLVVGLGISAVVLSIIILRRGKLYHRVSPEARPRRWVLISLLVPFGVFVIWFLVWMTWPDALISRLLLGLFAVTFFVVGMTIKWLTPLVDAYVKRSGWHLR